MEKLNNASRAKAFPEPLHAVRSSSDHPLHTPQRPPLPTPHRPAAQRGSAHGLPDEAGEPVAATW